MSKDLQSILKTKNEEIFGDFLPDIEVKHEEIV